VKIAHGRGEHDDVPESESAFQDQLLHRQRESAPAGSGFERN
jgi:hypothetical protein